MRKSSYHVPTGGLPPQTQITTTRAVFTEAYAVMPKGVMSDIVTSNLPPLVARSPWVVPKGLPS